MKCKEPDCDHEFDYSDEIIKDNLVRGIADPEILSDLLGHQKTDRTLEETRGKWEGSRDYEGRIRRFNLEPIPRSFKSRQRHKRREIFSRYD